ncbi:MAG: caspase family protein [Pseudomonadota bacterium]
MKVRFVAWLAILVLGTWWTGPAWGAPGPRAALVIGNSDYGFSPLDNPVNDARDLAKALERVGFTVDLKLNASRAVMLQAIRDFGYKIGKGGVGLFYYAGHGIQVKGENYLVPVDSTLQNEDEVEEYCLRVSAVLRKMETAGNGLNIIILDACRDNPFGGKVRSLHKGLAQMDAPTGSVLAYATAPGATAADGAGKNGLYTSSLLKYLSLPGQRLEDLFINVRNEVREVSKGTQVPWETSSLTGAFYFIPQASTPAPAAAVPAASVPAAAPTYAPAQPLPPPTKGTVDYDSVIKQRAEAEKQWGDWQTQMEKEYQKLLRYDQNQRLTPEEKNRGWTTFLAAYQADNPYSKNDENLRKLAGTKNNFWSTKSRAVKLVPTGPVQTAMGERPLVKEPAGAETFTNDLGMTFRLIRSGSFNMGSPDEELGRERDEAKVLVKLNRSYYIQTTEVTQAQWKKVMGDNPSQYKDCGENCPVDSVSWTMIQEFLKRLNAKDGAGKYRLPTEAEWEYACRAGSSTAFANGEITQVRGVDPVLDKIGWYAGNSGLKPHPVAKLAPNRWGLYDMHGNVYEWCQDWYDYYPENFTQDPKGPESGRYRVIRSGSWYWHPWSERSADRFYDYPDTYQYYYGFRLARDL